MKMKKTLIALALALAGHLLTAGTFEDIFGAGYVADDGWWVDESEGYRGPYVNFDGDLPADEERSISTSVTGPGTLRFKTQGQVWYGGFAFGVKVDGVVAFSRNGGNWRATIDVPVSAKGTHDVAWYVRNTSSYSTINVDAVQIHDMEWIQAPANLTVSFDCEGGAVNGEKTPCRTFATGACYGTLPSPVRAGYTFGGWYASDGTKVDATDYVIPSETNLFARWSARLEGVAGGVTIGNDEIYSNGKGVVIPLQEGDWRADDANAYFEVACEGEAIVSFDWVVEAHPSAGETWDAFVLRAFTVDGEIVKARGDNGSTSMGSYVGGGLCSRARVRAFLTPGRHTLRWAVPYWGAWGANIRCAVENFKVEAAEMQTDIIDWVKLLIDCSVWKPDNLAHLRDHVYGARIRANPDDYEARVIRAAITCALLAENAEVRAFIQDCGWTIADYTMKLSGAFCGLSNLAPANGIVDRLSPEALTALDDALADLDAIPENWSGSIELNPKKYEALNEAVYVDMAEITLFKAALESVRASLLLAKGYDFTMDYVAVSNSLANAKRVWDVLDQAPEAGNVRDADALLESKAWFKKSLRHIRRADQIILWRTNPLPHFFEYDQVDAANLARARLYLDQLIGSLDHPETIDLPYFVDKFGYKGETLPMGMFRQLYLGAIFAGRVTRDLVPDIQIKPAVLDMDTVEDVTLGGLLPDFGFEEFATLFPCSQQWSLALYNAYKPQSRLLSNQTLTVTDEAFCDGTLEYTANLQKLSHVTAKCVVDGLAVDTVSVDENGGQAERRSVAIQEGSRYSLVFESGKHSMMARQQVFEIVGIPEVSPVDDGTYSQTVNGVTWQFTVRDDEATVTGVSGAVSGDLSIPEKLGGRVVTAIGEGAFHRSDIATVTLPATIKSIGVDAFYRCASLTTVRILGEEPSVGDNAFYGVSASASVVFPGGTALAGLSNGKWQGMTVRYAADTTNEDLRVCASLPDGYEFNGMATLSLSVSGDATIYFTMNGADPTTNALVYASPISVSVTTRIKCFAVDNANGDTGPVSSLLLKAVLPDSALLANSECSKTVNGIAWSYQEQPNGVRITGSRGMASGEKISGAVVVPDAINWQPVTVVGAGLFASCEDITSVTIPATVTDIEREAFRGCTRLESIALPDGLLSIADGAFERCTSLTNVTIPASVTNIGYFAFRDCLRLTDVVLKGNPPRQDLGVYMGVPAFTTLSGRMGSATAIVYAEVTNKTEEITVPESWLDELAVAHGTPAGADSYLSAFKAKYGEDLKAALTKATGKHDLKGNPLYVWQDYVAGTDPLDEEDTFTATITMEEGVPVVRWQPELNPAAAAMRKYTVYGATALDGKWDDVSDMTDAQRQARGYQFFSVSVELR